MQLQPDFDDVAGDVLQPVTDLLFFRIIPVRLHHQKTIPLPAANSRSLGQQELCVTLHAGHNLGIGHVVSVEATKATAVQNPVAVLSLRDITVRTLVEDLTAWITRKSARYVIPAISDAAAEATEDAVRKLVAARAFPNTGRLLQVAASDAVTMQQLHSLLDLRIVKKVGGNAKNSQWVFTDFGASELRVASEIQEPEMVFSPLEDFCASALENASCWQLFAALKKQGFQVCKKPRSRKQVLALAPHTADNENLVWYVSGSTLQHLRMYMIALVSAQRLFDDGVVQRIHHCQPKAYYSQVLEGICSGSPMLSVADEPTPVPALQLDAEGVPAPAAPPDRAAVDDVVPARPRKRARQSRNDEERPPDVADIVDRTMSGSVC